MRFKISKKQNGNNPQFVEKADILSLRNEYRKYFISDPKDNKFLSKPLRNLTDEEIIKCNLSVISSNSQGGLAAEPPANNANAPANFSSENSATLNVETPALNQSEAFTQSTAEQVPVSSKDKPKSIQDKFSSFFGTSSSKEITSVEKDLRSGKELHEDLMKIRESLDGVSGKISATVTTSIQEHAKQIADRTCITGETFSSQLSTAVNQVAKSQEAMFNKAGELADKHTQALVTIGNELKEGIGKVVAEQAAAIKGTVETLNETLRTVGLEDFAREEVKRLIDILQAQYTQQVSTMGQSFHEWDQKANDQLSQLSQLKGDIDKKLKELSNLQSDVEEDSKDVISRLKKYQVGNVTILEQRCAQLEKDLQQAREDRDRLALNQANVALQAGALDPQVFARTIKENVKLKQDTQGYEQLKADYEAIKIEAGALGKYKDKAEQYYSDQQELVALRRKTETSEERIQKAAERANSAERKISRLEHELNRLKENEEEFEEEKQLQEQRLQALNAFRENEKFMTGELEKYRSKHEDMNRKMERLRLQLDEGERTYKLSIEESNSALLEQKSRELDIHYEKIYQKELERLNGELSKANTDKKNLENDLKEYKIKWETAKRDHEEDHMHVAGGIPDHYNKILKENNDLRGETAEQKRKSIESECIKLDLSIKAKDELIKSKNDELKELDIQYHALEGEISKLKG
jgi:chromosome segregation ATPase